MTCQCVLWDTFLELPANRGQQRQVALALSPGAFLWPKISLVGERESAFLQVNTGLTGCDLDQCGGPTVEEFDGGLVGGLDL